MATNAIRLLEVEPDLGRFLSPEDRAVAERLSVPVLALDRGNVELAGVLGQASAFGALILEGMILQRLRLSNHVTMKVHGPGDLVGRVAPLASMLITESAISALEGTTLALLGNEFLAAARRWPGLTAGLHVRVAQQAERLGVQLAICQLPRVDERLLALLWWLAEAWGRVTSVGTVVPINMTHDVLGALVGARRPTVTLALGELVDRGAIARQDRGWLLLEPPPAPDRAAPAFDDPSFVSVGTAAWRLDQELEAATRGTHGELLDTVNQLRAEHRDSAAAIHQRLAELRAAREELSERRRAQLNRRPAPS